MLEIVREVVADVTTRSTSKLVVAKQNDAGSRFLNVRIKDGGKSLDMPSQSAVILNAQRPDGSVGMFYGSVNDNGTVRVELNAWILEQPGTVSCDISVVDEKSVKLTTMTFYVEVEAAVASDESVEEVEEYSLIVDLLNRTEEAEQRAAKAEQSAANAAQDAEAVRAECEEATYDARRVVDTGVTNVREKHNNRAVTLWVGTKAEYEALDTHIQNCLYIITDAQSVSAEELFQTAKQALMAADNAIALAMDSQASAAEAANWAAEADVSAREAANWASSASRVTYTQTRESGEKIGAITIDGESTDIYAPVPMRRVYSASFDHPEFYPEPDTGVTLRVVTNTQLPKFFLITFQDTMDFFYTVSVAWYSPPGLYRFGNGTSYYEYRYTLDNNGNAVFDCASNGFYFRRIDGYA